MAGKRAEQLKRVTRNVTPIQRGSRMYYIECEMLVPHRFLVAVPAPNAEAACRLAGDVIRAGYVYGIPDLSDAEPLTVQAIKSGVDGAGEAADKIEPVPPAYRRVPRNVTRYNGA